MAIASDDCKNDVMCRVSALKSTTLPLNFLDGSTSKNGLKIVQCKNEIEFIQYPYSTAR